MSIYKPSISMNDILKNLNPEQKQAVTHDQGPLLIVAGAGTGKTTVITSRIAHLIVEGKAKSDGILALTFTEKAAGEMEERVDKLLPFGYLDLWISTFHGFGERILKTYGLEIGLPGDAKLLNEFEQWALVKKHLDKFALDYYRPLGNPTKFIHALVRHFSRLKDEDVSSAEYLKYANELQENLDSMLSGKKTKKLEIENWKLGLTNASGEIDKEMAVQEINRINEVANAYHVYQQLLLDNNALDFGDLINYTLKLLRERPAILDNFRRQFKYILLDEFQDTNWAQYELVKLLAAPQNNLVVVGDDDQSVYKFRGASISNILQFRKDFPAAEQIVLVKNYRSRQNILDQAYDFIQLNNPNRLEVSLSAQSTQSTQKTQRTQKNAKKEVGLSKKLTAQVKGEGEIEVIEGEDANGEVRAVVERIADLKLKNKDLSWNDFAVLTRSNDSAKEVSSFLEAAGLPYLYMASRGLYAKGVVMDTVNYLKLLDDYHESPALYRVLSIPVFNFSYQELVNFNYVAGKKAWSLYTVLRDAGGKFGAETQEKIDKVLKLIDKHTALVRAKPASEVITAFFEDSGWLEYLVGEEERISREKIGYLNKFMKRVQEFEKSSDDRTVKAFLGELALEIESGEEGAVPADPDSGPEAIKVMTVHGAKGLEFEYVFIVNLVDRRFPTTERKEAIEIPDALVKEILPEGDIHLEEERRLFYVAMTRAKTGLFFSWAQDYGGARKKKPSRFLVEAGLVNGKPVDRQKSLDSKLQASNSKQITNYPSARLGTGKLQITNFDKNESAKENKQINLPSYFSYTQLASFQNCPYQYRFAHILKVPRRGKPVFSFGKTMHAVLQKLFLLVNEKRGLGQTSLFGPNAKNAKDTNGRKDNKANISLDEIYKLYEECWIDDWYDSAKQKEEYRKKGREILAGFFEKYREDWPRAELLEKGFNFKVTVDGQARTVRGVIDRIDAGGDKIRIVDYKTGKPKDKLTFEEKEQLLLYQMAARDLFKKEVESVAFYYLDNNSEVAFLGTPAELIKLEEKIIATIKDIQRGEFPARPSQLCRFCDFFPICEFRQA